MLDSYRAAISGHDDALVEIERYKLSLAEMYGQLLAQCKNQWATEAAYTEKGRESLEEDTKIYLNAKRVTSRAYREALSALPQLRKGNSTQSGKSATQSQTFQAPQWERTCQTAFEAIVREYRFGEITRTEAKTQLEGTKSNLKRPSARMYKLTTQSDFMETSEKILESQFKSALHEVMNVPDTRTAGKAKKLEAEQVNRAEKMRRAWLRDFNRQSASFSELSSTYQDWLRELNSCRLQLESSRYYLGELRKAYLKAYTRKCKRPPSTFFSKMRDVTTEFDKQDIATVNIKRLVRDLESEYNKAYYATEYHSSLEELSEIRHSFASARRPLLDSLYETCRGCEEHMITRWTEARSKRRKGRNLLRTPKMRQEAAGKAFKRMIDAESDVYKAPQSRKRVLNNLNTGKVFSALGKLVQSTKWQRRREYERHIMSDSSSSSFQR